MADEGKFLVLVDSREQKPWEFRASQHCRGMRVQTLATGDYTLEGLEEKFVLERKGRLSELAANLVDERFDRELERLSQFSFAAVLCEFEYRDVLRYPVGSGIPRQRLGEVRLRGSFLLRRITELEMRWGVHFILAGKAAQDKALCLFKRAWAVLNG